MAEAGKVTCQSIFSLGPKINREIRLSANRIVVDVIPLCGRVSNRAARHTEGTRAWPGLEAQATPRFGRKLINRPEVIQI